MVRAQARRAQGAALSEPVFRREGDAFVPTGHARGPWDPGQLHGGAPGALIAEAIQEEGYLVARLTLDFLGPVPMAPLTVSARTTKPGRSFQLAEAELSADGQVVVRARAVRLRRGHVELPALAGDEDAAAAGAADRPPRPVPGAGGPCRGLSPHGDGHPLRRRAATSARVPRARGFASPGR